MRLLLTGMKAEVGLNSGVRWVYPMEIPRLTDNTRAIAQKIIRALERRSCTWSSIVEDADID